MVSFSENEKIAKLLKDFYTVTGQRVGMFDKDFNIIAEYPKKCCDFCAHVRKSKKGFDTCMKSDREFLIAASKGSTVKYRCHTGLLEICAPVIDDMGISGYFVFGQVLLDENIEEQLLNCKTLTKEYFTDDEFKEMISSILIQLKTS